MLSDTNRFIIQKDDNNETYSVWDSIRSSQCDGKYVDDPICQHISLFQAERLVEYLHLLIWEINESI